MNHEAMQDLFNKFGMDQASGATVWTFVISKLRRFLNYLLIMREVGLAKIVGWFMCAARMPTLTTSFWNLSMDMIVGLAAYTFRYDWQEQKFCANQVDSTFLEQCVQGNVQGKAAIKMMAFDSSSIYLQDFDLTDLTLRCISIKIIHKRPSAINLRQSFLQVRRSWEGKLCWC